MQKVITDDMDALLDILPPHIKKPLGQQKDISELIEVVLDLGRSPDARFTNRETTLVEKEVEEADIDYVVARVGSFGDWPFCRADCYRFLPSIQVPKWTVVILAPQGLVMKRNRFIKETVIQVYN